jgi:DHA3 family macrolide efflux protein-like MFS transporter
MTDRRPKGFFGFTLIWFGQVVSFMGSAMSGFALTIWAWKATGSATALAVVGICNFAPSILFSPVAGALVDRWNKKLVLILSDLAAGLTTVGILVIYLINPANLQIWHLCVAGVISGTFQSFQWPAYSTAISVLVPKKQYARSASMMSLAEWGSGVLSPVLAGALLVPIGLSGIFFIDIATFVFAILMVLWIQIPDVKQSEAGKESKGNLLQESLFGFKYIWQKKSLFYIQMVFFVGNFISSIAFTVVNPMFLARNNNNSTLFGIFESVASIGGLLGGLLITAWGGPKRRVLGVLIGWSLFGALGLGFLGFGQSIPFWMIGSFFGAFTGPLINSSNQAIWQAKVPPDIQGKVFSVRRVIAQITGPIGMLLGGVLADRVMEPAFKPGGFFAPTLGKFFGTVQGSGMSLMIAISAILIVFVGLFGYLIPAIRNIEDIIPDHDQMPKPEESHSAVPALD